MHYIIGIDEAGRGAWAGPVVAGGWMASFSVASALLDSIEGLNDSKLLKEAKREKIFQEIEMMSHKNQCYYEYALRDADIIDSVGIREANRLCMEDIIVSLLRHLDEADKVEIFIDGCDNYRFDILGREIGYDFRKLSPSKQIEYQMTGQEDIKVIYRIGGDKSMRAISAASIVAKVTRDRMMCDFSLKYPDYHFDRHKGYGTRRHYEALIHYGITPLHRKSYAPVKRLILSES